MGPFEKIARFAVAIVATLALAGCLTPAPNPYDKSAATSSSAAIGSAGSGSYNPPPAHSGPVGTVTGGTVNAEQSQGLSDYLKHHSLPLVSAQVVDSSSGARQVILNGFVASDYGKTDAENKSRKYLNDTSILVDNRIRVSPELADVNKKSQNSQPPSSSGSAGDPYAADPTLGSPQDYANDRSAMGPGGGGAYSYSTGIGIGGGSYSSMSSLGLIIPLMGMMMTPSTPHYGYGGGYPASPYGSAPYGYGGGSPSYPPNTTPGPYPYP